MATIGSDTYPGNAGTAPAENVNVVANALGTPHFRQVKIVTSNTPVQGPNVVATNGIIIKANPNNAQPTTGAGATGGVIGESGSLTNVIDGSAGLFGFLIIPGESTSSACSNGNQIWFNGIAGDIFYLNFS